MSAVGCCDLCSAAGANRDQPQHSAHKGQTQCRWVGWSVERNAENDRLHWDPVLFSAACAQPEG
eukprot:7057084-Alexandrium_andersonii.AAC.1